MTSSIRGSIPGRIPGNILVATEPAAGHVHPTVPVVRELVARGHRVRWLTGSGFAELVESTGAVHEPFVTTHDPVGGTTLNERFPERAGLSGVAGIRFDIKHVFLDQIPGQVADLQRVLAQEPADLLLTDTGFMGAPVLHELGGPRWASISVTPLALPSRDVAPFGPGLPPLRTRRDRLRAAVLSLGMRAVMRDVEKHHSAIRAGLGLRPSTKGLFETVFSPYLVLQTGTALTDYPRSDLPTHVHYVGPLTSSGPPSAELTDWRALAAGRPIVVLTQGTVATSHDSLIGPGVRALAEDEALVVAIGGTPPASLPRNAVHVPYLPYEEILPAASAMVTNGGYGGVQIALSHGVPLAVAGTTEDKPEVAARVAWSGVGLDLRTDSPTEAAIRGAVRRLLTDDSIRQAAARVARHHAAHDAPRTAANLVEELLATAGPPTGQIHRSHRQLDPSATRSPQ